MGDGVVESMVATDMSLSRTENGSKMSPQNNRVDGAQITFTYTSGHKTADSLVERLTGAAVDGGMSA